MSSSTDRFFPDIDPKKKPDKPEPIEDDWTVDEYDENCANCGQIYAYHTLKQALFCAKRITKKVISKGGELR